MKHYVLVATVAIIAYGAILWNGAGFSHPDDLAVVQGQSFALSGYWYRPVTTITYMFNRQFGGWTATGLALHVIAALLVMACAKNWVAGCLFAAHPMACDAVVSIAGRSMELFAIFAMLAYITFCSWRFKLAVLPALMAVLSIWTAPSKAASAAIPLVEQGMPPTPGHIEHVHLFASALGGYVLPRMVVPVLLSADPLPRYSRLTEAVGWITLPLTFPLIPYFLVPLQDVFLEHRAYLAIAVICAIGGYWLRRRPFLAAVIIALFTIGSWQRVAIYSSPVRLWEDARAKAPDKGRVHFNLGVYYANIGLFTASEVEMKRAIELMPQFKQGYRNLANLYALQGRISEASMTLDRGGLHDVAVKMARVPAL